MRARPLSRGGRQAEVKKAPLPQGYPQHRIVDVGLRDGSTIRVRPVRPDDDQDLIELFARLSRESLMMRFHGMRHVTRSDIRSFVDVDYRTKFSLVAETAAGSEPRIIALGSYVTIGPSRAEMAIVVDDPFHGKGVGSILLEHLSEAAVEAGIDTFEAEVLSANRAMLEVMHATELPLHSDVSSGVIHFEMPTSPTDEAIEAFEQREAIASAAAVRAFLQPRSVAVIGASRRRGSIGGEVFRNLLEAAFEGPVYPVNPNAGVVQSVPAYRSILDIPGSVDLAVILVPAATVLSVAEECAEKGVRALLVISAGFSEIGEEGVARQNELLELSRRHGMRIIGPNCMGIMNTDPDIRLDATFAPNSPPHGRVAFSSQSGALGIAVIDRARELGLGLSSFVSVGNKADISGNDLLQYWEQDEATDLILLYLESFGNPRKFARIARRVSRRKPIIAVKSGRSEAGARAAASHTGSIVASDIAVDALFRQTGVIRTDTLEGMFDVASLLATQSPPKGNRVAILTNAGGLGVMCADACEASGLEIPELSSQTRSALAEVLAAEASVANPVDMIASATPDQYRRSLSLIAEDPNIDSIVVIFIPPLVTRAEDVAAALVEAASGATDKTILSCFLGVHGAHEWLRTGRTTIPSYAFPEAAAQALSRVAGYADWRRRPEGQTPGFEDVDRASAFRVVAENLTEEPCWLEPVEVSQLLDCYGIRSVASRLAESPEGVAKVAADLGRPVVVKIASKSITHKTDVGGVRLDLETPERAASAAEDILNSLRQRGLEDQLDGFLVQEMARAEGAEMFVGVTNDPTFGPVIACGAGGTLVELMRDVAVRITPLTDADADAMLRSLRVWPLFEGYRGKPPLDALALEELLLRLSALVEDLPHVAELDLNPVLVDEAGKGCMVLDARIRIAHPEPPIPRGARTRPRT